MLCGKCGREMVVHKNGVYIRTKEGNVVVADHFICAPCIIDVYANSGTYLRPIQYKEEMIDIDFF